MSNINLLPWRDTLACRRKKQFSLLFSVCLCLTTVFVFFADWLVEREISYQRHQNQRLQKEITILDNQLGEIRLLKERRKALLERMHLIERLQLRRNISVRLFNQLPELIPDGVYLNTLSLENEQIDINGKTEAYGRVATMMRSIDNSDWLGKSKISTIFLDSTSPLSLSQFSMMFKVIETSLFPDMAKGDK
ncbi:PilN domain-containing protein [Aeromonas cavernicola]|uniref:Fimbrial protein n=1 Tax=Aeromonas cavernicola TaxID=1006623 RepID=A0A2H9U9M7_9GAMM|nr:PilN domain-containing protein [Aeromonas cavernicola]PJG60725.1 fimbrial protein [Aeromonas cavernicola]